MTQEIFRKLLQKARSQAFEFALMFVTNELKEMYKYDVQLNQSCDTPQQEKFDYYLEDDGKSYEDLEEIEVVELLVRRQKIPVWIDINVKTVRDGYTIINLYCAGRYSGNEEEYYYKDRKTGPFGVKSPWLPPFHEKGTKFKI